MIASQLRSDPALWRVNALRVARIGDRWEVRILYHGLGLTNPSDPDYPVDLDQVPDGIKTSVYETDPDGVIWLDGDVPSADVEAALYGLASVEALGTLSITRIDPAGHEALAHDPWPRWTVGTHATTEDKMAWLQRLKDGGYGVGQ